jgi:peptidoglycan/LPS O-acetylase OafA/YrhL
MFSNGDETDFLRTGYFFTWIVGLPVWLLGVVLADQYKSLYKKVSTITYHKLWFWRIGICIASACTIILRFHFFVAISYSYTMPIFSLFAYFWIKNEVDYYKNKKENEILKFGGLMSYSLYLMHTYVIFIVGYYGNFISCKHNLFSCNPLFCMIAIGLSLIVSWIFYIVIEKPSHKLVRSIKI